MDSYAINMTRVIIDIVSSVRVVLENCCLDVISETVISVSGSVNCNSPVRVSGIFPVAKENNIRGVMDTAPDSHINRVDCEVSLSGGRIVKSNSQRVSVRQAVRKRVSMNVPFTASRWLAFFK